jgi:glycosyltransferase involved in cell wall biosynthesis
MIVKNEEPVLERCLQSVRPLIDAWCIVDTGSTDGTRRVIQRVLGDLPGELHEHPWQDFAHNRTRALELARRLGDYVLVIDADEVLVDQWPGIHSWPCL